MKKTILIICLFSIILNSFCQSKYWEGMDENEKNKILNDKSINPDILKYYQGKSKLNSDDSNNKNKEILTSLTENTNDNLRAFYFFVFNQICLKSDGALSEILGNYCITMTAKNSKYVFEYFTEQIKINKFSLFDNYVNFIGSELYFANKGNSDTEYNYNSYKDKINKVSATFSANEKHTLELFWKRIDKVMKNME
jgi:hypothetical protein